MPLRPNFSLNSMIYHSFRICCRRFVVGGPEIFRDSFRSVLSTHGRALLSDTVQFRDDVSVRLFRPMGRHFNGSFGRTLSLRGDIFRFSRGQDGRCLVKFFRTCLLLFGRATKKNVRLRLLRPHRGGVVRRNGNQLSATVVGDAVAGENCRLSF